ncbi:MAG: twin-arginine translocase subunit TatC, partial [Polaribacter sp.]|nr:twin-arginine translocase subunit TatC [Polaribacter sp.]
DIQIPSKLQSLALTQQLMSSLWVSLILGFILAFPYILWEMWRFIAPGLHKTERNKSRGFLFIASLLFFIGVLFSYYVIMPMSVSFFYGYKISDSIVNNFTLDSYISLFTNTMLGISLVFELPVVIYFLSKLGLVTPEFLRKYRKHSLVLVLLLSAIITPPDVASQIIVSIPILILYEVGIYISGFVQKRQLKNAK